MLREYFEMGGPVMWGVLAAWVVVAGTALERALFWLLAAVRQPARRLGWVARREGEEIARVELERELDRARHGLHRLDVASQLATSIGLFGTVLGIAQAFFGRADAGAIDPEVLGASLATALFTTIAGLAVFLVGQVLLAVFHELESGLERRARAALTAQVTG